MKFAHFNQLCDLVRETSFAIRRGLRHGHPEKTYENALAPRLRKQGLIVRPQPPLQVSDEDGTLPGDFSADLFGEDSLMVALKAVRAVVDEHVAQLLGYLRSSRQETGLLRSFGAPRLPVKKYLMTDSVA